MSPPNTPIIAPVHQRTASESLFEEDQPAPAPAEASSDSIEAEKDLAEFSEEIVASFIRANPPFLPSLPAAYIKEPFPRSRTTVVDANGKPSPGLEHLELIHPLDFSALDYFGTVEQNLICPICRVPFCDPVMTTECLHVFCRECMNDHIHHHGLGGISCPIDRKYLDTSLDDDDDDKPLFIVAPPIIRNQVDALLVICPVCSQQVQRSLLQNHLSKVCLEARMACAGKNGKKKCSQQILRKNYTDECLHFPATCPDCFKQGLMIDMDHHKETQCEKRPIPCNVCGAVKTLLTIRDHHKECPDMIIPCKWSSVGCKHKDARKLMENHETNCDFQTVGQRIEGLELKLKEAVSTIEQQNSRVEELEKKDQEREKELKKYTRMPIENYEELVKNNPLSVLADHADPVLNTGYEYVVALLDVHSTRLDKLEASLKEVDGRTTLVFNENLGIQNEFIELRSLQQTTSMHVRWLLQFRLQENRRLRAGTTNGSDNGGGSDSGSPLAPRRSSDSMQHEPPRL